MKSKVRLIIILAFVLSLQSCVRYKPNTFDSYTNRYNDYKKNYSIMIVDGYKLLSQKAKQNLRKTYFQTAPKDVTIFYNKQDESAIAMFAFDGLKLNSIGEKYEVLNLLEKEISKLGKICKECKDIQTSKNGENVSAEFTIENEFTDARAMIKIAPYPSAVKDSRNYNLFTFIGASKLKFYDGIKDKFTDMYASVKLTAFEESERSEDKKKCL